MALQSYIKKAAVVFFASALALAAIVWGQTNSASRKEQRIGNYRISGPFTHNNLTIFLIRGEDGIKGKKFLTLKEAMERKAVIVNETGSVNELSIENLSQNEVYIQSGEIVKGGKQDRVLAYDLIVPPKSGKIPIASFCVESGRWQKRGNEEAAQFSSSTDVVATKDLKIAAKQKQNQSEVWNRVAEAQEKLSDNVGEVVQSKQSASSLQLSLENRKVRDMSDNYVKALSSIIQRKGDVIGYAFAINGKMNSVDVYASNDLFLKLWPKLLKAAAIEAVAEKNKEAFAQPTVSDLKACILDAEKGKSSEKAVTGRVKLLVQETDNNILFETRDLEQKGAWVHRNYIAK